MGGFGCGLEEDEIMGRRRPEWTRKPSKPLTEKPQPIKGTKSPKGISIERKDGTIEVIKEA